MNRFCFVAVWLGIFALGIQHRTYAQAEDTCRMTYDFLWEVMKEDSLILPANSKLRLAKDLFNDSQNISPIAPLYKYQYLRPATRQEIKDQKVRENEFEVVRADSNVYAPEVLENYFVFFKKPTDLHSSVELEEVGGKFIVPAGLKPASLQLDQHKTLDLIAQESGFWELKAIGETWIFYPQIFDPYTVFDIPKDHTFLQEKTRNSQQLIGKTFIYLDDENHSSSKWEIVNIKPTNSSASLSLSSLDSTIADTMSLVLSKYLAFEIYDPVCLEKAKKQEAERLALLVETEKLAREKARQDSLLSIKRDSIRKDSLMQIQIALEEEEKLQAAIQAEIEADRQRLLAEMSGTPLPSSDLSRSSTESALMKKFVLIKDPVLDWEWYLHENQSLEKIIKESYLKLNLNEYGEMYLLSILTTDTLFKHVRVQVTIEEEDSSLESDIIYTYDDRNVVETYDGYFQEKIHFTSKDTQEIIERIVENYDSHISISFINEDGQKIDTQLSIPNRVAFRDTYLLHEELKQAKQ